MEKFQLYEDIATRTNGDIYVGVVGPVRTGKSTFIKRFMETSVLPNIEDKNVRERATDELPQGASGKTVMTTQPKFVPNDAVRITLKDNMTMNVRLIDCVGYLINGALGDKEDGRDRLVSTPWSDEQIPFYEAAKIGTDKVIKEHSTIGIVMTTDGSIAGIDRKDYIDAEEKVIAELKGIGKPFVIVLNCKEPKSKDAQKLKNALCEKYGVATVAINAEEMGENEADEIFKAVLLEFPIKLIDVKTPKWLRVMSADNDIIKEIEEEIMRASENAFKMRDYESFTALFNTSENIEPNPSVSVELGEGKLTVDIVAKSDLFNRVLSKECDEDITEDYKMMAYIRSLRHAKREYERIKDALNEVNETGYGIVMPTFDDMILEKPEPMKHGSRFGVKLKASAPSLHIMRVDVETEVSPIVGTEQQGEDMVKYLMNELETDASNIWNSNMFGKSLNTLVKDGLDNKLNSMPKEAQAKLRKTVTRIVNEGKGGVICILL